VIDDKADILPMSGMTSKRIYLPRPLQYKRYVSMEHLEKPQIIIHSEKSLNYTVFGVRWMPSSAKIVVLGSHPRDTGALQVYELSKGQLNLILEVKVCYNWNVAIACKDFFYQDHFHFTIVRKKELI